jgi:ATP synthase subunit 6
VFTLTAQIAVTLRLALPFWLGFILFSFTNNPNHFLRHLVPLRTPLALSQFIVLIERVSQIIRPITLSVRLAANITAGHILIALCSNTVNIIRLGRFVLLILILLETAVAFIQRYVFTVLISIYIRETYDKPTPPFPYSLP